MKRVVIIGGGITGLAAAHRILERTAAAGEQVDLTLLEASDRLGGIVHTEERDGFLLERGPDAFISEKPEALELARRLGLESHLIETNESHRRSFVVSRARLLPVPEGFQLLAPSRFWPFVKSDIFSWTGKARMALDLVLPRRQQNGRASSNQTGDALDVEADESLAQFVRRRLGREALERMAQPMVGGIYTADPEQLSLRATMPRFLEMEREHRSLIRALRKQNRSPTFREGSVEDQGSSPTVREGEVGDQGSSRTVREGEVGDQGSSPTIREGSVGDQGSSSTVREGSAGDRGSSPTVREGVGLQRGHEASGARYSLFLSFDRGMQVLTDTLADRISHFRSQISDSKPELSSSEAQSFSGQAQTRVSPAHLRVSIKRNTAVVSLALARNQSGSAVSAAADDAMRPDSVSDGLGPDHSSPGKASATWTIKTGQGETLIADAVCLALPAYVSARLLRDVDSQLASELDGIPYASSATINLAYKREDIPHPLDGFGFVVPFVEKRTLMACTFSSVKFGGRAPQGHALLRAFVGGALQPELFDLDEAELVTRVRADLRVLLGIERAPLLAEVSKWERSMPQYHVGHLARVRRIEARLASLPAFALAGNAYSGLGIPDCIRSGQNAAERVLSLESGV